ncbi:MAG: PilW family protein [Gammaproteobacteria bacterium]|nr:PilW family protein [Gammaproteobacteria bacterium]MCB1903301.1 PilW family protein [Gammaproteobacteria bacterium]
MRQPIYHKTRNAGFGLVEILIALVLGMIMTIGMTNVFLSSKQAYRTQDALSVIQENGRYAMEVLARNIRMSGYQGCGNLAAVVPNVLANNMPGSGTFSSNQSIRGYEYSGSAFSPLYGDTGSTSDDPTSVKAGSDVITVSRAERVDSCGGNLNSAMTSDSATLTINGNTSCDLAVNDYILITDCETSDLFQITGISKSSTEVQISHGSGSNSSARLSKPYSTDGQVFKFIHSDFFLRQNSFGQPALFVRENGGTPQELVDGIQDLELLYGEDTNSDLAADQYVDGATVANWANVTSVRMDLTLVSKSQNVTVDSQALTQQMNATVGIRNKLP